MAHEKAYLPVDFPVFELPGSTEAMVKAWGEKLRTYLLHNVLSALGIENAKDVKIDRESFYEIFTRIEKRRVYFHVYHNGMEMGELNEGALFCFWILKLTPFKMEGMATSLLNTKIAYIAFVNLVHYIANKTNKKAGTGSKLHVNMRSKLMRDMLYTFQYRDLSKEAIMAMAESHLY
jgi:hypothetical protein